jgi:hypothetical protein
MPGLFVGQHNPASLNGVQFGSSGASTPLQVYGNVSIGSGSTEYTLTLNGQPVGASTNYWQTPSYPANYIYPIDGITTINAPRAQISTDLSVGPGGIIFYAGTENIIMGMYSGPIPVKIQGDVEIGSGGETPTTYTLTLNGQAITPGGGDSYWTTTSASAIAPVSEIVSIYSPSVSANNLIVSYNDNTILNAGVIGGVVVGAGAAPQPLAVNGNVEIGSGGDTPTTYTLTLNGQSILPATN